jgi:hypothetical protein
LRAHVACLQWILRAAFSALQLRGRHETPIRRTCPVAKALRLCHI